MSDETRRSATPSTPKSRWASCRRVVLGLTFSRFQAVVGTLAATASLVGAAFSLMQFVRPANTGELVTIVQAAGSHRSVTDAIVEVLTTQNAIAGGAVAE